MELEEVGESVMDDAISATKQSIKTCFLIRETSAWTGVSETGSGIN